MKIWEAYCNSKYYNLYFNLLVDKGMSKVEVEEIKGKYWAYIQRLKETMFNKELNEIEDKLVFKDKLQDIFDNKWKGHLKYPEMCQHFYNFLKCIDSIQCIHNDFINDEEKKRLTKLSLIESLTDYEIDYMVDGKLVALMNPTLLYILRGLIVDKGMSPAKAVINCQNFYDGLLDMSTSEYKTLILKLWSPGRRIKTGGGRNQIRISFPDADDEILGATEALIKVVSYYGFDEIEKQKIEIRGEKLLVRYLGLGQNSIYEMLEKNKYVLNKGNTKDKLNALNVINQRFGNRLKFVIE